MRCTSRAPRRFSKVFLAELKGSWYMGQGQVRILCGLGVAQMRARVHGICYKKDPIVRGPEGTQLESLLISHLQTLTSLDSCGSHNCI